MNKLEQPLNANERYLYGICTSLDALTHMFSSFIDVYANQNEIATTQNTVKEKEKPKTTRKRKTI